MRTYFYCALGQKDDTIKQISGLFNCDSEIEKPDEVFRHLRNWLKSEEEFEGNFTITAFNEVSAGYK